jgi:Zn-dependent protease with chaperone function
MYAARYFDRQNLKEYLATVWLQPGTLFVQIETESGNQTLEWGASDLHSIETHPDGQVIVQNGKQFVEIKDFYFKGDLERSFAGKKLGKRGFFDRIGLGGCLVGLLLVTLPFIAIYLWVIPVLANEAADKVPVDVEMKIGDAWFQSLTAQYTIDSSRTQLIQEFYDSLHYGGAYDMRISLVNEPVVNAFAMPGGHIVVFDSILQIMDAPEQLAALLAHEASHVQLKHSTRAIFRQMASTIAIVTIFGDFRTVAGLVAQQTNQLAGLSYSRSLEMEADKHGLALMEAQGIPLQGMPDLFRRMESTTPKETSSNIPNFLSTHPALEERIQTTEETAKKTNQPGVISPGLVRIWQKLKSK